MPGASRSIVFNAPMEKVYGVISDYANYPQFVPKSKSAKVLKKTGDVSTVQFEISLGPKDLKYTLDMKEERPNKLTWKLVEGEMMKANEGGWVLEDAGEGKTKATYTAAVEVGSVPLLLKAVVNPILNALVDADLPNMLEAFRKRIESR